MFLTDGDVAKLFPEAMLIEGENLIFQTMGINGGASTYPAVYYAKKQLNHSVFISVCHQDNEVSDFPIFYTNDLLKGLKKMITLNKNKLFASNLREATSFILNEQKRSEIKMLPILKGNSAIKAEGEVR